jgi:hypothetical protein
MLFNLHLYIARPCTATTKLELQCQSVSLRAHEFVAFLNIFYYSVEFIPGQRCWTKGPRTRDLEERDHEVRTAMTEGPVCHASLSQAHAPLSQLPYQHRSLLLYSRSLLLYTATRPSLNCHFSGPRTRDLEERDHGRAPLPTAISTWRTNSVRREN